MKPLVFIAVLLAAILYAPGSSAEDGKLRKCSFYEIMNDEDEDGLVQGPSGQSVCYYLHKDASASAPQVQGDSATQPGGTKAQDYNSSRSNRRGVELDTGGGAAEARQEPDGTKAHKKGYDHYSSQSDGAESTMQKARHDAMQTSPRNGESKVEVRGWDPEKKEAIEESAEKK